MPRQKFGKSDGASWLANAVIGKAFSPGKEADCWGIYGGCFHCVEGIWEHLLQNA
jgi:hypothetical protein